MTQGEGKGSMPTPRSTPRSGSPSMEATAEAGSVGSASNSKTYWLMLEVLSLALKW
jgi:hypothetical protein